jgi:hypothetical protein
MSHVSCNEIACKPKDADYVTIAAQVNEEVEACSISGVIPEWVGGSLLLNGGAEYRGKSKLMFGIAEKKN